MTRITRVISISLAVVIALSLGLMYSAPSVVNSASAVTYTCNSIKLDRGTLTSGNAASLNKMDSSNLIVNAAVNGRYYYLDWSATYTLPGSYVTSLSLSYKGKYSSFRGQNIYLYNYKTCAWTRVDYRTVGPSIVTINLSSISGPASYVSAGGQVQVRVYSYSTAGFTGYCDYLAIGAVVSADAPPAPSPTPPAPPSPSFSPTPTPSINPALSGTYKCNSASVVRGSILSGNSASLNNADGVSLSIGSALSGRYSYLEWTSDFDLPSRYAKTLSLSYKGKYSSWRTQSLYLYNYSTAAWTRVDARTIGASIVTITLPSISGPSNYISASGILRVKVYSYSTAAFSSLTDLLNVGVTY